MRIDPVQVVAIANQEDATLVRRNSVPHETAQNNPIQPEKPALPNPSPTEMSVSIDGDNDVIYQFLDSRTGEVVQQVPPEQVLQVMRSIAELLRQAEQKLNISV